MQKMLTSVIALHKFKQKFNYIPPSCNNLYILDSTSNWGCFDFTDSNFTATSSVDEMSVPVQL